jgi:hypothetical protein
MLRLVACGSIALAAGAAHAQITPDQHLGCATSYMVIRTALSSNPLAGEWQQRMYNSMNGLKVDGRLSTEEVMARVREAGYAAIAQYNSGALTPEKVTADVDACDALYGFALVPGFRLDPPTASATPSRDPAPTP